MRSIAYGNNVTSQNIIAPPFSDQAKAMVLAAGVAQSIDLSTLDGKPKYVALSSDVPVFAEEDNPTIAVPDVTDSGFSKIDILSSEGRRIHDDATTLDVVSETACKIVVRFYA